jgi:hypothetical protein
LFSIVGWQIAPNGLGSDARQLLEPGERARAAEVMALARDRLNRQAPVGLRSGSDRAIGLAQIGIASPCRCCQKGMMEARTICLDLLLGLTLVLTAQATAQGEAKPISNPLPQATDARTSWTSSAPSEYEVEPVSSFGVYRFSSGDEVLKSEWIPNLKDASVW